MINFANPELLYLLLLVPAIGLIYFLGRLLAARRLKKFGNPAVIAHLMPERSRYMPAVKIVMELTALVFLVLA